MDCRGGAERGAYCSVRSLMSWICASTGGAIWKVTEFSCIPPSFAAPCHACQLFHRSSPAVVAQRLCPSLAWPAVLTQISIAYAVRHAPERPPARRGASAVGELCGIGNCSFEKVLLSSA